MRFPLSRSSLVLGAMLMELSFGPPLLQAGVGRSPQLIPQPPPSRSTASPTVLIGLKPGMAPAARHALLQRHGLLETDWIAGLEVSVAQPTRSTLPLSPLLEGLSREPLVRYAERDEPVTLAVLPNDLAADQWNLYNQGQDGGIVDADIDATDAWELTTGSGTVVVAVLDTGIDLDHEDLEGNLWTNSGEVAGDGRDNDGNGYVDDVHGQSFIRGNTSPNDIDGHGTHSAGIIGARTQNGLGLAGVCWNVQLMAVKFIQGTSGSSANAAKAILYAVDNGADILNASFTTTSSTRTLKDAVRTASDAGVLFIAAAGNAGTNNDTTPNYPASYDFPTVIAVAATDRDDGLAYFSNTGARSVDLAAPGDTVTSTWYDNGYRARSGTSQAAPHVAGAAALVWSRYPDWSPTQVRDRLLSAVDPLPSLSGKVVTGGRLNAALAVR